jgi:hypothetical protein
MIFSPPDRLDHGKITRVHAFMGVDDSHPGPRYFSAGVCASILRMPFMGK